MFPSRPLRIRSFLIALGVTFAACYAAAVALPHDPYVRYQAMAGTIFERARWIYERIHFDETPVDIVFLGASRTARGVISPDIEARLAAAGFDRRVVNFALPASGLDIQFALAREVLETRDVEILVVTVVEQFPRDGHQAFGDLATAGDVLSSPWIVNRNLPKNLARLPVRQIQLALGTWQPKAFGYRRSFDPATYAGSVVDPRIFNPGSRRVSRDAAEIEALDRESAFRRRNLTPPILPEALGRLEFGIPRFYIRRIAELAEARGARLVFLYLPFYGGFDEPREKAWLERYGPVLSATFLRASQENFSDVAHLSDQGAEQLTDWLVSRLIPLLQEGRT